MFPSSRTRGGGRVDFHPGRGGLFRIVEGDGGGKRKVQRACLSGALGWFKFRWNPARERVGSCEAVGTIRQVGRQHTYAHAHAHTHRERRVEDKGRSCNAHSEWRIELGITTVKSSRDKRRSLHPIGLCILPGRRPSHPSIHPSSFHLTHPFASGGSASTLERPPGPSKHILINGPSTPHGIRTEEKNLTQNENSSKGIREIKKAQCSVVHCRS